MTEKDETQAPKDDAEDQTTVEVEDDEEVEETVTSEGNRIS